MEDIVIIETLPSAEDYNRLRQAVGWGVYQLDVIEQYLPRSLYGVCAVHDGQTIGMARVIGDGGLVFYIQDVIVLPGYQRQGVGSRLMDSVMAYLRAHVHHNSILGLMSATSKEAFYEKYGFTIRPTEKLGAGMTMFWRKQGDR
jgi:ribosomal protein S18 acetylase RimI-like enzyme